VTENFFGTLVGDTPAAAVVAFINSRECCECFLAHIHPFGCGVGNANALSLFPYGPEWGGPMLMLAALPNVSKNDAYQIEESVVIMDNRISACIPMVKESTLDVDFAVDIEDESEPCYYQLNPQGPCVWTLNTPRGVVSGKGILNDVLPRPRVLHPHQLIPFD
jgi:hypothetical protein